nr:MAG: DNA pilot protein [Microviridae sp.]
MDVSAIVGILSAITAIVGTIWTNASNSANAQKQQDFQRSMSNTAHQREVADLRSAGLNPILSATGGNGASTPSGAMATMVDPGDFINKGVTAYAQSQSAINTKAQTKNVPLQGLLTKAQTNVQEETQKNVASSTALNEALKNKTAYDQIKTIADTKTASAQQDLLKNQALNISYKNAEEKVKAGLWNLAPNFKETFKELKKRQESIPIQMNPEYTQP